MSNRHAARRPLVTVPPLLAIVISVGLLATVATSEAARAPGWRMPAQGERMEVCVGREIPYGWVIVDAVWRPTKCADTDGIEDNVWVLERHLDREEGATMTICMSQPTPRGWVVEDTRWSATHCEKTTGMTPNTRIIRRVGSGTPAPTRPSPDAPTRSVTGIYSDMGHVRETGDVIGTEIFILYAADGPEGRYWAVVQFAEGVPEPPQLVPVEVRGSSVELTASFAGYDMRFRGRIGADALEGEFDGPIGRIRLPRRDSFWQ